MWQERDANHSQSKGTKYAGGEKKHRRQSKTIQTWDRRGEIRESRQEHKRISQKIAAEPGNNINRSPSKDERAAERGQDGRSHWPAKPSFVVASQRRERGIQHDTALFYMSSIDIDVTDQE